MEYPRPKQREPAYIHLTFEDSSTISYVMPLVADASGFDPILEVHLDTIAMTTSLSSVRLLNAESCRVCHTSIRREYISIFVSRFGVIFLHH